MHTRRPWLLAAALAAPITLALGCDDEGGPSGEAVLVEASVIETNARIVISDDGSLITGATVELNGIAATPAAAGEYLVNFPSPLNDGDAVTLSITAGGAQVEGSGTFPESAVTTAPADGADFGTGQQVPVSWTSGTDPFRWVVIAEVGGPMKSFAVAGGGAARSYTIAGGELGDGGWVIEVVAEGRGELTGDFEQGSLLVMAAAATADPVVTIGTQPM